MKVLVTGGTGLVGSHASRALMAGGHEVRLLVRSPDKALAFFDKLGEELPELIQGDITDVNAVRQALAGCDRLSVVVAIRAPAPTQAATATAAPPDYPGTH